MVFFEKATNEPSALGIERLKPTGGNYREPTIIQAIKDDFFDKCYICESKGLTSINIEHFAPHRDIDMIRKYNWSNLFWSCSHCNTIKSSNYDGQLLNCTIREHNVDTIIKYELNNVANRNEDKIVISSTNNDIKTLNTVELLNKVYKGTTDLNKHHSSAIRNKIFDEIFTFKASLDKYIMMDDDYELEVHLTYIKRGLSNKSPYSAFKRSIIRNNPLYSSLIIHIDP